MKYLILKKLITECSTTNPCPLCSLTSETNLVCRKQESLAINNSRTVESFINVTGLNAPLSSYAAITAQIWLIHTYNGDLIIRLYGPDGSYIPLSDRRGRSFDNVFNGTLFTDSASNSVSSYSYSKNGVVSPLKPEQPFSSFRGKNPNGQWKLWIHDSIGASNDIGTLNGFILNIQGFFSLFFKKEKTFLIKKRWVFEWKSMWKWDLYFHRSNNFYM